MSTVAAVPRNTGVLFVGRVAAQGLAVVMTVVLAARLGVTGLGEYALVSAVVFVANVATTFGTDMVLVREIAAGGRVTRWVAALVVQLGLSAVAIVLIAGLAPVIPGQSAGVVAALRIYSLSLLLAAVYSVSTAVLRGVGMTRTPVSASPPPPFSSGRSSCWSAPAPRSCGWPSSCWRPRPSSPSPPGA